ncbi:alpha-L-fucosidase-like [Sycon ciliatum]|uniref:alpha-L-fucosidase-like n=1 Tax=Sycon ciliatum TaxID=27933 RepID=UPI0031F6BB63
MKPLFFVSCGLLLISLAICQVSSRSADNARYEPTWKSLDNRPLPGWYDDSKVGIFIHWGVFSVPALGEWFWEEWKGRHEPEFVKYMDKNYPPGFEYADFGPMFKADLWNPDEWADLFAKSGAKYIVLTSKHHEGFTLWPSAESWNWNSMDTGPHRDLVGELAAAVRKHPSLHFGLYHSLFEWFNPIFLQDQKNNFTTQNFIREKTGAELYEIVKQYKPDVIWSDGDWSADYNYWNSTHFLAWLYNDSPVKDTVVVNDRWGIGSMCQHGDFFTCADRYNPGHLLTHKWENAMSIDKNSWGLDRTTQFKDYLTIQELINEIVITVSCGGNILVNVGPGSDGRILPIFQERLLQMGAWLEVNGEAIYGSHPWSTQNDTRSGSVWYTRNEANTITYAIALTWPESGQLVLGSVAMAPSRVTLLGYNGPVHSTHSSASGLTITLPQLPAAGKLEWAWTFKLSYTQDNLTKDDAHRAHVIV